MPGNAAPSLGSGSGLLAELQAKKLRSAAQEGAGAAAAPVAAAPADSRNDMFAEIRAGGRLRKVSADGKGAGAPPPQDNLQSEILGAKLKEVDSRHKRPGSVYDPFGASAPPPPPPVVHQPPPAAPAASAKGAAEGSLAPPKDGRPIAPFFEPTGEPIADWKRRVLQKKLDTEWEKEQAEIRAKAEEESKWEGIPAWKRNLLVTKADPNYKKPDPKPDPTVVAAAPLPIPQLQPAGQKRAAKLQQNIPPPPPPSEWLPPPVAPVAAAPLAPPPEIAADPEKLAKLNRLNNKLGARVAAVAPPPPVVQQAPP
jgi:epidermal growth factor receptor kinase substrate 8